MTTAIENRKKDVARRRHRHLMVLGAVLAVAVVVFTALGLAKPNPLKKTTTVHAIFRDSASFEHLGQDVRAAGLNVGKVGDIKRSGDKADVELVLEQNVRVARDATAEVRPHTAFEGNSFVELYPGSSSEPKLGNRPIALSHTRDYVTLDKVLRVANAHTRDALRQDLRDLARTLGPRQEQSLQQTFKGLPPLYKHLAPSMRAAQGRHRTELEGTVRGLAKTVGHVSQRENRLVPLLRGGERSFAAFNADSGGPLDQTLAQLPPALDELQRGGRTLRGVVDRLDPLAVDLRPAFAELAPGLRDVRPLLAQLGPVLADARPLVHDLNPTLAAARRASGPARRLLAAVDPNLKLLRSSTLPTLHKKALPGAPVYSTLFRGGLAGFGGALKRLQDTQQGSFAGGGFGEGPMFAFNASFYRGANNQSTPNCSDINPDDRPTFIALGLCQP